MPNRTTFVQAVWESAGLVGHNSGSIADDVMETLYPKTCAAAQIESAFTMFRTGVIDAIKRILKERTSEEDQSDFADIAEEFTPIVRKLNKKEYYVESLEVFVPVSKLIAIPRYLDDARKFMRRKGNECLEEAGKLDKLYEKVTELEPVS